MAQAQIALEVQAPVIAIRAISRSRQCMGLLQRTFPAAKEVLDYVAGVALLVLTSPILLILAALVKLTSRGPALYSQVRVGRDGRLFRMLKLRSMYQDSEDLTGPVWASADDPRITPLGRFMRKTHLDELPQLINVLRGDMSIVGPRPERPNFVEQLCGHYKHYRRRMSVKPGITGLAQVRHPYDETLGGVKRKLALDLLYIRRMCWMVELTVLWGTLGRLTGKGAH